MLTIKIYPSKHEIKIVNESRIDTKSNIPLSYINIDRTECEINHIIESDFLKSDINRNISMTPLLPGDKIDNINSHIYNMNQERLATSDIANRINNEYYFTPAQEFMPNNFSYVITAKKKITDITSKKYNLNIGCKNDTDSIDLSSRMSKIFTDPSARQLLPPNISINHNDKNLASLLNITDELDFLFMETWDGYYMDSSMEEEVGKSSLLDKNINVWIGCEDHYKYKITNEDLGPSTFSIQEDLHEFNLSNPIIDSDTVVYSNHWFNLLRPEYQDSSVVIHTLFPAPLTPVLILEHKGKGFEIISHNDILRDPVKNKKIIYEVMMYVYSHTYKKSQRVNEWISYTVPDYEIIGRTLQQKTNFASSKDLTALLKMDKADYYIYQVDLYNNNTELPIENDDLVSLIDTITHKELDNRLVFEMAKTSSYVEPTKPEGWVSVYKDNRIYYLKQLCYYIESNIKDKLFLLEEDNMLNITLYPFKSSKYGIDFSNSLQLSIPTRINENGLVSIVNEDYCLYLDLLNTTLQYIQYDAYDDTNIHTVKLAKIEMKSSLNNTYLTDIRQLGGGLSEEVKDDYDLLDIGHINGRPYRKGNTLVITMPKKYEQYKEKILAAINKYKVGEDYAVVFFEDEE